MRIIHITIILFLSFALFSCDNQGNSNLSTDIVNNTKTADINVVEGSAPQFLFDETEHNFGNLIQGEKVTYNFTFTNTGGTDLLINRVTSTCGCTVSNYSRVPIKSREKGTIEVTFNSRGKKGHQNKAVTVMANTEPNKTVLRVKARVLLPEQN